MIKWCSQVICWCSQVICWCCQVEELRLELVLRRSLEVVMVTAAKLHRAVLTELDGCAAYVVLVVARPLSGCCPCCCAEPFPCPFA